MKAICGYIVWSTLSTASHFIHAMFYNVHVHCTRICILSILFLVILLSSIDKYLLGCYMKQRMNILHSCNRENMFASLNGTLNLSTRDKFFTIALIYLHYLYTIKSTHACVWSFQKHRTESVKTPLRILVSSASRLHTECKNAMPSDPSVTPDLTRLTQEIIARAYDIAKSAKQLVTCFQWNQWLVVNAHLASIFLNPTESTRFLEEWSAVEPGQYLLSIVLDAIGNVFNKKNVPFDSNRMVDCEGFRKR